VKLGDPLDETTEMDRYFIQHRARKNYIEVGQQEGACC
jgi:hypothetical protein